MCVGIRQSLEKFRVLEGALRPALVLIANDQEWSARSIESVLAPQGFAILRAFTGQQAIDRALSARPDLMLLDAQLPDIHGFDVCRRLRESPAIGHAVPIIITTAGPSGRQQRLEASRAGAWDFLGQPLDAELMLARVEAFIQATDVMRRSREEALVEEETGLYTARGLTRRLREVMAWVGSPTCWPGCPRTHSSWSRPAPGKPERGGSPSGWPARSRTIFPPWAYDCALASPRSKMPRPHRSTNRNSSPAPRDGRGAAMGTARTTDRSGHPK